MLTLLANFDDSQDNQPPALITNHFTDRFQRCFIFTRVWAIVFEVRVHSSSDRSWAESVAVSAAIAKSEQKPQE